MKKIVLLGSTGSIGMQSLDVISKNTEKYKVVALTCAKQIDKLAEQIEQFRPRYAAVSGETEAFALEKMLKEKGIAGTELSYGADALRKLAKLPECDVVINSLLGISGLMPTYSALEARKTVALANKETIVTGGKLIMEKAAETEAQILPVDSEHSAIFQCLQGNAGNKIRKILLTASGGPFRGYSKEQLNEVTVEQALKHPNWGMGKKITVDSATLMNKGLEVIEARWLFDVTPEQIQVLVHPQSIVHSMVEYEDMSVMAQMGAPDMRIPISYALSYPERLKSDFKSVNFFEAGRELTFEPADTETFKCLQMAYDVLKTGGDASVVLNAANEVLVEAFLNKKIAFTDIQRYIERALNEHPTQYDLSIEGIGETDLEVRRRVNEYIN